MVLIGCFHKSKIIWIIWQIQLFTPQTIAGKTEGLAPPGGQRRKVLSTKAQHRAAGWGAMCSLEVGRGSYLLYPRQTGGRTLSKVHPTELVYAPFQFLFAGRKGPRWVDFLGFSYWTITDFLGWVFITNRNLYKYPQAQASQDTYTAFSSPFCTMILAAPTLGRVGFTTLLFQRNLTFSIVPTSSSASNSAEWVEPGLRIPLTQRNRNNF